MRIPIYVLVSVLNCSPAAHAAEARTQAASVPAQVPNFSGHWVLQPDPNGGDIAAGGAGVVIERRPALELTVTQDSKTLTTSRTNAKGEVRIVVNLDGSDSKNGNRVSNARWVGSKLEVTAKWEVDGTTVTSTTTWWMDGSNLKMQVKTVENAGTSGSPANEMVNLATYKKK